MRDYTWTTSLYHPDNSFTMDEFLRDHLEDKFFVCVQDGTYAEITDTETGERYECHAGGDGDSFNHRITFKKIED